MLGALGMLIYFLVVRENRFASATVDVVEGQTVVSTGPYAIVRHPMYAGAILVCLGAPLALGSWSDSSLPRSSSASFHGGYWLKSDTSASIYRDTASTRAPCATASSPTFGNSSGKVRGRGAAFALRRTPRR